MGRKQLLRKALFISRTSEKGEGELGGRLAPEKYRSSSVKLHLDWCARLREMLTGSNAYWGAWEANAHQTIVHLQT